MFTLTMITDDVHRLLVISISYPYFSLVLIPVLFCVILINRFRFLPKDQLNEAWKKVKPNSDSTVPPKRRAQAK